jgi:CRP-like cAMP-binding protein
MLCGNDGFTMNRVPARIHAPGFSFTAYLKSDFLRKLNGEGFLEVEELHPGLNDLLAQSREALRSHFRQRLASLATSKVNEWKQNDIYPYQNEPTNDISRSERQVFDILALNVSEFSPGFNSSDAKVQALSFRLLREAIEESPDAAQRIIAEVLDLPEEKREQLARLLDKTSLSAIINASKEVADRLDFIRGLEVLVFEEVSKQTVLERRHLHRILAKHTWLFGEEFGLSVDDQSLNAVLERHIALLGREEEDHANVTRLDGSHGIVNLMLSRRIPQTRQEEREHLVI